MAGPYRKKQLYGQVRTDVWEIIQTLYRYKGIEIIEGAVCLDHVHLCVSIQPKMSISTFVGYLKGKSTLMIYDRHPSLLNKWNKAFWARGYYVATIGNVTFDERWVFAKNDLDFYESVTQLIIIYVIY